jgi:hypothetical protein
MVGGSGGGGAAEAPAPRAGCSERFWSLRHLCGGAGVSDDAMQQRRLLTDGQTLACVGVRSTAVHAATRAHHTSDL